MGFQTSFVEIAAMRMPNFSRAEQKRMIEDAYYSFVHAGARGSRH
jgi:hypothetical protein